MPGYKKGLCAATLMCAAMLSFACNAAQFGGGAPHPTPYPAGEVVDLGGWNTAQTWLVNYNAMVELVGNEQASGWLVSVKSAGPCTTDPAMQGQTARCVLLSIQNTSSEPGGLDLAAPGPKLLDPNGESYDVTGVRLGDADSFVLATQSSGKYTSAVWCSFSAPDADGRQEAECESMLETDSNGQAFEEALFAVGADKVVELEIAFQVSEGLSGWVLEWPTSERLALP